jgi:hypothetical protein
VAENTAYFEWITANRAVQADEQQALEGTLTISAETQGDLGEGDIGVFVHEDFPQFLRTLRFLSKEDQELLLSYYVLNKSQNSLAPIYRTTQTICSFRLREAVKRLGTFIMLGHPTREIMSDILTNAGLERAPVRILAKSYYKQGTYSLSLLIDAYAKARNFQTLADHYKIWRPDIRRAMSKAYKQFKSSTNNREVALGAYIFGLIDKASYYGAGKIKRQLKKQGNVYRTDPAILDQFRINAADPDFEHVFTARANN